MSFGALNPCVTMSPQALVCSERLWILSPLFLSFIPSFHCPHVSHSFFQYMAKVISTYFSPMTTLGVDSGWPWPLKTITQHLLRSGDCSVLVWVSCWSPCASAGMQCKLSGQDLSYYLRPISSVLLILKLIPLIVCFVFGPRFMCTPGIYQSF